MAALSQALITFCLWYSFKAHMDEASTTPQPIFKRLGLFVVIRGTFLTLAQLLLIILFLARPDQLWWTVIHQALPFLYYTTAISTLKIRLELLERPRMDEESQSDNVSESGIYVKVPTPAAGDLLTDYTNHIPRLTPASNTHPVEARQESGRPVVVPGILRPGQAVDTKEIRLEWTPPQEESGAHSPAVQVSSSLPALTPNRLNQDSNPSHSESASSKVCPGLLS
ncbi:hypothetical protein AAF712_012712 [Marasmius tenuissimus]|uniref:DUF6534 domain-containing protein n=1 Tax=Marasmius tenuissimus TaxID=585030 RepID=A0ABR2ZHQ5_9AGAR